MELKDHSSSGMRKKNASSVPHWRAGGGGSAIDKYTTQILAGLLLVSGVMMIFSQLLEGSALILVAASIGWFGSLLYQ
ncbi:MAG: hypothetical protein LUC93_04580 [Planctomycetaceae bacterium]|nr:hypothetical protein [Planctomycetaceae bacterium]